MRASRVLIGLLPLLAALAGRLEAAPIPSDSLYADPDLRASTAAPWNPPRPVSAERSWETALRFPGRIASLPLVAMGTLAERSLVYLERSDARGKVLALTQGSKELGIVMLPASLGDNAGLGAEVGWAPRPLRYRVRFDVNATTNHYNRERVLAALGPVNAVLASEWRPREQYFGAGMSAPLSGESDYGERSQSARLVVSWGWFGFDSTKAVRSEPLMFRDRVRLRGPLHRTWVSAWAGPREVAVSRGRDPDDPSFEIAHPLEAAGSLDRRIEQFAYGVGFSHDGRWGLPRWSSGWRASLEAERYDRSIRAVALDDAHSGARSFTRLTYHLESAASFGRDPRTLRLALTAVDQRLDSAGGTFLVGDLQSLGGGEGLRGFAPGRFRDVDLMLGRLSYLFPLITNLELELHAESGGVYPGLTLARLTTFENSFGTALRLRTDLGIFGGVGFDRSREQSRIWITVGGLE